MSLLSTLQTLFTDYGLLQKYGPVVAQLEAVLTANNIDVEKMIADATGATNETIDLTTIKGIQTGLNKLGTTPPLTVDGSIGTATVAAILAFQVKHGLDRTRCPDVATVDEIKSMLAGS